MISKRLGIKVLILSVACTCLIAVHWHRWVNIQWILLKEDTALSWWEDLAVGNAILQASLWYRLDPLMILAVMKVESEFQPDAVSPRGAHGLMQLKSVAAREVGVTGSHREIKRALLDDRTFNIQTGCAYLRFLLNAYDNDWIRTLAAYNLGPAQAARLRGPSAVRTDYVETVLQTYKSYRSLAFLPGLMIIGSSPRAAALQ